MRIPSDAEARADLMAAQLAALGSPVRAASEQRYLKSDLRFLGVTMGQVRALVRSTWAAQPLDRAGSLELASALWSQPVHERRTAAVLILGRAARTLGAADLPLLQRLTRESRTWALVDPLATDVIGPIRQAEPTVVVPILDRWATDSDFWVRRASLLAELRGLRAGGPLGPFLARADGMLEEREFFIRKAIGWVLREAGRRQPNEVAAWLAPRTARASGVTMREATKYLAAGDASRLMVAHRERRPA